VERRIRDVQEERLRRIRTDEGEEIPYELSSGNVFSDLGLPDPETRLAKAELVRAIDAAVREHKLSQRQVGELLGIKQPEVSRLLGGRTAGYSSDRLMHYLTLLKRNVKIVVEPTEGDAVGNVRVLMGR
jgi:predicted XRE-type DNA-binding protein